MFDHQECLSVGSVSPTENPGIVIDSGSFLSGFSIAWGRQDYNKTLIDENLPDIGVRHQGVLGDQNGVADVRPVDFVDFVAVCKSKLIAIVQIVWVYGKASEAFGLVEAIINEFLLSVNSNSVESLRIVQHVDLRQVDTDVGSPKGGHFQESSINNRNNPRVQRFGHHEHINVSVVLVLLVYSIEHVPSQ